MQINVRPYRRFSILLAGLVLLSAVGLRLDVHYCQGQLAGVSLMLPEMESCHKSESSMCCDYDDEELPCCEDHEMMASMDYDGPVVSYLSFDRYELDIVERYPIVVQLQLPIQDCLEQFDTGPPLESLPSGIETRIRYQSFLC